MSEYILKVKDIMKSFGGVHALRGVSLDIKKGEIHCLAGENGSGKSTLIKIISGVYTPDAGTVEIDGKVLGKITPSVAINAGIQVIYQDYSVFPNLTVMENLAMYKEVQNPSAFINWKQMRIDAQTAVDKIGFKVDFDELVGNLPVAEKQLIAISRALLHDAKLIIMDEPTTALTEKEVDALFTIIRNLQKRKISILFVSHKLDEVFEIAERFTIFRNGQNVISADTKELDDVKFSNYMTGREFSKSPFLGMDINATETMGVKNLFLAGGFSDVSFSLHKGEVLGITGLLGSGRNELVQSLFGIIPYESGKVFLNGKEVKIRNVRDAIAHKIGYVPEDRLTEGLFLRQSVERNIGVSKLDDFSSYSIIDHDKMVEEVEKWVKIFSIDTSDITCPVQTLSGGNQQKVVLSRWLANDLDVLILNGPTVGVDIGAKYDIHALIRKLAEKGLSVIIVSDDLPEVLENCQRVLVMRKGKVAEDLATNTVSQKELSVLIAQA
ncbi:sugar ABC transporter ATP-binding protein [uncultured Sphaerochaeta sp.]|uniref:sugar ABC transporter ATP-binding protein n=1 Tax=uncultured Sphaerochaeta sp. TaxID=886478 RepID=UPI002A0A308F|nr:sugar ABC transporter ATP-binding protein [uncultured Sphaerochaeta sp.]